MLRHRHSSGSSGIASGCLWRTRRPWQKLSARTDLLRQPRLANRFSPQRLTTHWSMLIGNGYTTSSARCTFHTTHALICQYPTGSSNAPSHTEVSPSASRVALMQEVVHRTSILGSRSNHCTHSPTRHIGRMPTERRTEAAPCK